MNYLQIQPIEPLRKYIRYFWVLENDSCYRSQKSFKIIPDGLPGLIFQDNPKAFCDQDDQELPQMFLYGQTTRHTVHKSDGKFRNLGIYFQPTALKSFFGIDANELTDRHIGINDLIETDVTGLLSGNCSIGQQVELLTDFFLKRINQKNTNLEKVDFATTQIQKGYSLKNIQTDLKISERSLERYFKQYVGISPKLYARISRFQSALAYIRNPNANLSGGKPNHLTEIAYRNDYFDQSHFIRDFNEFAGTSPKHFILQANEQVANFPEWKG
ncbi:DUF6597 domain-containing transcriptional factor [Belliella marina]|uniref:DUF6597 domain-containing transcriptional factor n=1 Tax=Belliella marina TaxID=1644146 RepID=A0ABW4VJZ6_9BACT